MRIIFILIILIFLFSVSAKGSDWEQIYITSQDEFYIYKESILHQSKEVVRALTKIICLKNCEYESKYIKDRRVYEEHDCKENKYRILQISHYYTDGTIDTTGASGKWIYIPADSATESIHKCLCKER